MAGTVTGWRSLPSQPTAVSIPATTCTASLKFDFHSGICPQVSSCVGTRVEYTYTYVCICCARPHSAYMYIRVSCCASPCGYKPGGFSSCGARSEQSKRTRSPKSVWISAYYEIRFDIKSNFDNSRLKYRRGISSHAAACSMRLRTSIKRLFDKIFVRFQASFA